ncbi:MAG TPA: winged helix-turn-helix domain-containing protein [Pyrinomonadaceae bacterium]|nr:winged helix-turn-helix domain-containing protein [Pyrinomonadaceae bacterium]
MSDQSPSFYDFGPFRLDVAQHMLLREGDPVALTPKAFQTLTVLVRNNGRVVEKDELLRTVWPDANVEEATLAQNIFTLRKILGDEVRGGDQYIQTIPKRGYRFIAKVAEFPGPSPILAGEFVGSARKITRPAEIEVRPGEINSIAVLPLISETTDPDTEYLIDGIIETVVNCLSLIPQLQVKACSTVMRYKGRKLDPQQVGRELGVGMVLIGRVLAFAENVIVRIELVDVLNGWQIWGEQYCQRVEDLLLLPEVIAESLAKTLHLSIETDAQKRLLRSRTRDAEAYQFYLKGRYFLSKRNMESYEKAIAAFARAIELDPNYSQAYSGLSDSYIQYDFYGLAPPWQTIQKARDAAAKAVKLDDDLVEGHNSLASIKLVYDRDVAGAGIEFRRAIKLNPKYAHAHNGYAHCLMEMGRREESLAECELALELEPFDLEINQHLALIYLLGREYDRAIEQLHNTIEMGTNQYRARLLLGIAYGQKGLFSDAISEFHQASKVEESPVLSGFLGYAYGMAGRMQESRAVVNDLLNRSKRSYVPAYSLTLAYIGLGQRADAVEWLGKAFIEHSRWRGWFQLTPEVDDLRSDPQIVAMIQRARR